MRTALLALLVLACLVLAACGEPAPPVGSGASVAEGMGATDDDEGYSQAGGPRPFVFPADHGPHPDYRTEWWYWTGHLEDDDGHRFGYQLTFFRNALAPPDDGVSPAERPSRWAADQVWLAHFAVTDVTGGGFISASRTARGALGLAGARAEPFRVHVAGWEAVGTGDFPHEDGRLAVRLRALDGATALDLQLSPGAKPPVLHGDRGFSTKGSPASDPRAGRPNASYYFSLTRLPTEGTVSFGGETHDVTGSSWLDREWFTGALSSEQIGWNWFSLQLSDGRELMLFALRRTDGTFDPEVSGTLVEADGSFRSLSSGDVRIEPTGPTWESPRSGAVYPAGWRLAVAGAGIDLAVHPLVADQELDVGFRYFEGVVGAEGESAGRPVAGTGYAELTGYAEDGAPGR